MLWVNFLEKIPPGKEENIEDLLLEYYSERYFLNKSEIQLFCNDKNCKGKRSFRHEEYSEIVISKKPQPDNFFMTYVCKNCSNTTKTFALSAWRDQEDSSSGVAIKYGEIPAFGPPLPPKVISLIGPDRELFLKGRRSENQGLGIGAFAYYRQIIEGQSVRLISEIKKAAQRLNATTQDIEKFDLALKERQFGKAVEKIKTALPPSLLIDGNNPLTLLHSALSEGIHAGTDEECLEFAQDIRVVLTELAERITSALRDQAQLHQSVNRLLSRGQNKPEDQGAKDQQ